VILSGDTQFGSQSRMVDLIELLKEIYNLKGVLSRPDKLTHEDRVAKEGLLKQLEELHSKE
jgi:hypothetical protein